MFRMSFSLPVVQQKAGVPSRAPCCRSVFIRHHRSKGGLTDNRRGEAPVQRRMSKPPRKTFTG
jgi:hypothetical protein